MIKKIAIYGGLFFVVAGLIGLCVPGWIGMRPSAVHNLMHVASGAVALFFGSRI
jgi:hypothetical protein